MTRLARFEGAVLPYLDAAYNLARWLTRDDHDAQDVVQEAYLRAFRYFDSLRDTDARAWLLAIVRNTGYSWLEKNRPAELVPGPDAKGTDRCVAGDRDRLLAIAKRYKDDMLAGRIEAAKMQEFSRVP